MANLHTIALASVIISLFSTILIIADILLGNKQHMKIMNDVWPLTALYARPLAILTYYTTGRKSVVDKILDTYHRNLSGKALHCSSACMVCDIFLGEISLLFTPVTLFEVLYSVHGLLILYLRLR